MRHDAHGHWIHSAGAPDELSALEGERSCEYAIVGGGYTGMWSAWWLKQLDPDADVVLIEADRCGHGPSGRNAGFCNSLWFSLPTLVSRFGDERALTVARLADRSVRYVGEFCEANGVEAHYRHAGYLQVSTCEAQDGVWDEAFAEMRRLGVGEMGEELTPEQVRARCNSPRFRAGAHYKTAATVDPSRLATGLRDALLESGVEIYEHTPLVRRREQPGGDSVIETPSGTLRARRVILGMGGSLLKVPKLRHSLTGTSSHMLVTEPVPELLEEIGWTGGECVSDSRHMLHYFRTTADGRIAFGWGGGGVVYGSRLKRGRVEVDPAMARQVEADLRSFFPGLEGKRVDHAWGGPIDVSPSHLPLVRSLGPGAFAGFGYTGNGVGPSQMIGRSMASLAAGSSDEHASMALVDPPHHGVPPEPFRFIGGSVIRSAMLRKERLEEEGRRAGFFTRAVSGIPERVGIHVGR
jgi:glycine/D-amino acid oxidase-like deaminating enzyme